jgi:uncharacterized protein
MDVGKLAKSRYISLTTFRRDGTPVATPVWMASRGEELVVYTSRSTGKVKRLRSTSRVLVGPCDMRGRPTGEIVEATARLQDEAETAATISLIRKRYGLQARLLFWWYHRHAGDAWVSGQVGISIRFGGSAPTQV